MKSEPFLTSFSVSNFKPFKGRVDVPLRKMTLLYGPNSAGKSSLLDALRLYIQSSASEDPKNQSADYLPRLHALGDWVDLLSCRHATHLQDETLPIEFEVEAQKGARRLRVATSFVKGELARIGYWLSDREQVLLDATFSPKRQGREGARVVTWTETNGEPGFRSFLARNGVPARALPRRPSLGMTSFENLHFDSDQLSSLSFRKRQKLSCLLCDIGRDSWAAVSKANFLRPVRVQAGRTPNNVREFDEEMGGSWVGDGGELMLDVLAADPSLEKRLNEELSKLEISYEVKVERPLKGTAFEGQAVLALRPKRGSDGMTLFTPDVGFGVGQVLPLLVAGLGGLSQLVCVQQPELHLHPKLQAQLADFFINTTKAVNGPRWLLETHSEHLVLRLLKRIRETTSGSAPPDQALRPEDVAVLYVEPGRDGSKIHELRISPDGDFLDRWPNGFFEERAQELF